VIAQAWRIRRGQIWIGRTSREASMLAAYIMLAKHAQASGVMLYWRRKLTGKQLQIIEYKGAEQGNDDG